ncbi:hypothetical protein ACIOEW_40195, partial [Streptomyces sp. NPDC087901]|uniref:hypothetical protein n=1 Tax=Streptomyces sp. NPDC087901 TaxID=3365818 RepID=UPI0037F7376C
MAASETGLALGLVPAQAHATETTVTGPYQNKLTGSDAVLGDRFSHAAWRAGVVMTISNSTGVSRP